MPTSTFGKSAPDFSWFPMKHPSGVDFDRRGVDALIGPLHRHNNFFLSSPTDELGTDQYEEVLCIVP